VVFEGVSGLYPGDTQTGVVDLSNPNPYPLTISSVDATSDSTCFNTGPRQTTASLVIPPATLSADGRTYTAGRFALELDVSMPLTAPPSCASTQSTVHVRVVAEDGQ